MKVYVKLYALLRKYHPGPDRSVPLEVELPEGATVADLIPRLTLPVDLVRSPFVNDDSAELSTSLRDGDRVNLFPPVVGGSGCIIRISCARSSIG